MYFLPKFWPTFSLISNYKYHLFLGFTNYFYLLFVLFSSCCGDVLILLLFNCPCSLPPLSLGNYIVVVFIFIFIYFYLFYKFLKKKKSLDVTSLGKS